MFLYCFDTRNYSNFALIVLTMASSNLQIALISNTHSHLHPAQLPGRSVAIGKKRRTETGL